MKTLILATIYGVCLYVVCGCAARHDPRVGEVGVESTPSGASIYVDRQLVGKTPSIIYMTLDRGHIVKVAMDGYDPYEIYVARTGMSRDAMSLAFGIAGRMAGGYQFSPNSIRTILVSQNTATTVEEASPAIQDDVVEEQPSP